jgi:hypothetical protein
MEKRLRKNFRNNVFCFREKGNGVSTMMGLEEIRNRDEMINVIDWDMTPEDAVTLYLEWGNNPATGRNSIRSKNDVSHYFVVNTWEETPKIYFIRRNSDEAVELATIDLPEPLRGRFLESIGHNKGVYALNDEIKTWLKEELHGN